MQNQARFLQIFFLFSLICTIVFFSVPKALSQQNQSLESDQTSEPQAPQSIPITEITNKAKEVYSVIQNISTLLDTLPEILKIVDQAPIFIDSLRVLSSDPIFKSLDQLNTRRLENLSQEWIFYKQKFRNWETQLVERSQSLQNDQLVLDELKLLWKNTQEHTIDKDTPQQIRERILSIVTELDLTSSKLVERLEAVLSLRDQITTQLVQINDFIRIIKETESLVRKQVLVIDSPPFWDMFSIGGDSLNLTSQIRDSWADVIRSNMAFVSTNKYRFYFHIGIFLILLSMMLYLFFLNKKNNLFDEEDEKLRASAFFISRPLAASLLISLFLSIWIYPNKPLVVSEFIFLLILIPVVILIPRMVTAKFRKPIYFLIGLYVFDLLHKFVSDYPVLQRLILLLITLSAIFLVIGVLRYKKQILDEQVGKTIQYSLKSSPLLLLVLCISFLANIFGAVSLAGIITVGIIESANVAVVLYAIILVLDGLIALLIKRKRAQSFQMVKTYAQQVEKRVVFLIHLIAFLIWLRLTLSNFGLYEPILNSINELGEYAWDFGTLTISIGAIFDFLVVLIVTFLVTRIIRIFLELEVFPRIRLPRGIPGAITMVVRYTLVTIGIFLAISSLGFDLGEFGLLAGALGVGLGFGLQNIIANFVSGLILAFERPIQAGDTVEVGNIMGNVQAIGVRSSTVKTFDGSEVIVPNADLISNQVTNWTLTDKKRRIQLPVKVAFGNDPHQVLELLLQIVRNHPEVLEKPEPIATFNGFGDNFLDFTLYYWISDNILKNKTEVALGVHDILKESGIDTPTPQRDLKIEVSESSAISKLTGTTKQKKNSK